MMAEGCFEWVALELQIAQKMPPWRNRVESCRKTTISKYRRADSTD
jgi:hypothetical protein